MNRNAGLDNPTILVVDDEPEVLSFVVDTLEHEGFATFPCSDSKQALGCLDGLRFDVIVTDVMMPGLNGLSLLKLAKQRDPNVEVVVITAYGVREIAVEAWAKGACSFLEKPFSEEQLVGAVRQAYSRARFRRRAGHAVRGPE